MRSHPVPVHSLSIAAAAMTMMTPGDNQDGFAPQASSLADIITPEPESEPTALAKKSWHVSSSSSSSSHLEKIVLPIHVAPMKVVTIEPEPTVFTSYDVLLAPSSSSPSSNSNHKESEYTLINHVGSRRFLVFLGIYRQRYIDADERGDHAVCLRIVLDIIKTIRQQCQPNGRFLQQGSDRNEWFEIGEVATLVCIVSDQLTKNVCSLAGGERAAKRAKRTEMSCEGAAKKTFPHELSQAQVDKAKPFDVICNSTLLSLQANSNHVGNNRLQVLLDIRRKQFDEASTHEERNSIVNEIVTAIIDDSGSQFLSLHASSGHYTPLSREAAAMCVKNAMYCKPAVPHVQKSYSSEASRLLSRHHKKHVIKGVERRHNDMMKEISMIPGICDMDYGQSCVQL